jgi:hypothetical protein
MGGEQRVTAAPLLFEVSFLAVLAARPLQESSKRSVSLNGRGLPHGRVKMTQTVTSRDEL